MKQILKTFLPIYISMVFATVYNVINVGIFAKNLDKSSVAALGVAASLMFLMQGLALGLASGFLSKISKNDTKSAAPSLIITTVFSVLISALTLVFLPNIVYLLNADDSIIEYSLKYLRVSVSGFVILALYRLFESWLYAVDKAKTVLYLSTLMLVLQVFLTYLLVAVWQLGVVGGAIANVVSFFVCGLAALIYILKTQPKFLVFKQKISPALLKASLPLSFMQFFKGMGLVAVQISVGRMGADASSAFAVCQKLSHVATDGATALNSTSIKQPKSKKLLITIAIIFSLSAGILLILVASPLSRLIFKSDGSALTLIKKYFYFLCPFLPALLTMVVLRAGLFTSGHPYLAMTEGIVEFAIRIALIFFIKDFKFVPLIFGISWTAGLFYLIAIKKLPCVKGAFIAGN